MKDPVEETLQYIRSDVSKRNYRICIGYFLKWSGMPAPEFVNRSRDQPKWAESIVVSYVRSLIERKLAGSKKTPEGPSQEYGGIHVQLLG
jgi:hypothetical protein